MVAEMTGLQEPMPVVLEHVLKALAKPEIAGSRMNQR
jgi:hypothetical protein